QQLKGTEFEKQLADQFEELLNPATALDHKYRDLIQKATDLGRADLTPAIEQMKELERTSSAFLDVFGEIERGAGDVFSALISGTRSVKDALQGFKLAFIRSFTESFAEGIKKKLG